MQANKYFIQTNGYGDWQNVAGAPTFEVAKWKVDVMQKKYPGSVLRIVPLAVAERRDYGPVWYYPFAN